MIWKLPFLGTLRFNPIVSFFSILLIWSFVVVCIVYQENVPFYDWRTFIVDKFSWLYVGGMNIWGIFVVMLYFSKYSNIKLGKAHTSLIELKRYRAHVHCAGPRVPFSKISRSFKAVWYMDWLYFKWYIYNVDRSYFCANYVRLY